MILLPSQKFSQAIETPYGSLLSIIGWASFGVATHCYALGIMKRPLLSSPMGHAGFALGFGTFGYFFSQFQDLRLQKLEYQRDDLVKKRAERIQLQASEM